MFFSFQIFLGLGGANLILHPSLMIFKQYAFFFRRNTPICRSTRMGIAATLQQQWSQYKSPHHNLKLLVNLLWWHAGVSLLLLLPNHGLQLLLLLLHLLHHLNYRYWPSGAPLTVTSSLTFKYPLKSKCPPDLQELLWLPSDPLTFKCSPGLQVLPWPSNAPLTFKCSPDLQVLPWPASAPLTFKCSPDLQVLPFTNNSQGNSC